MNNEDLFYGEKEPEKKEPQSGQPYPGGYQQGSNGAPGYNGGSGYNNGYNEYGYPPAKPANGLAIAALVTGLISLCCCVCFYVSLPCAIAAIITAILSRKQGGMNTMAIIGLITGIIGMIIAAFMIMYVIYVMSNPALYQQIMDEYYRILESMEHTGSCLWLFPH